MTMPPAVMDNSLSGATGELESSARILRWRPGLHAISLAEEANFHMGLHLKGKDFRSFDEVSQYLQRLIPRGAPVPKLPGETPFERAQALVYETIGAPRKTQVEKCRQALEIYPGCADAWVILSKYEKDAKARLKLLQQAVRAGQQCLRDAGIEVDESGRPRPSRRGDGPGATDMRHHPARPYMRARLALAEHLYEMAERPTAIADYRDLLELNPRDDQGIRYLLVRALLELGGDAAVSEATALVEKLRDASPMWAWTQAFLAILGEQDGQQKRHDPARQPGSRLLQAVAKAYWANPLVPDLLLGRAPIPKKLPDTSAYGSEEEALIYGAMAMRYWSATPGARVRLSDALKEVTAGLPSPFGSRTPLQRRRIEQLWHAYRFGGRISTRDRHLLKVLLDHPEYAVLWPMAGAPKAWSLNIDGTNPFVVVVMKEAVEQVLDDPGMAGVAIADDNAVDMPGVIEDSGAASVRSAMKAALRSLMQAGESRYGAISFLAIAYAHEWAAAQKAGSLLDPAVITAHLRCIERLASGELSPAEVLVSPGRNQPCPCGSGRKFKECCGWRGGWPAPAIIALARSLKPRHDKAQAHLGFGRSPVMGQGVYASVEELHGLEPGDPLVILDNTSAVAEDLWEAGWQYAASRALQDNVDLARTLPDRRHLVTALREAVSTLLREDSYQDCISQYACELASMVEDPGEASELWAIAGRAFLARGKPIPAEHAINRAMSTGRLHPLATLARAQHLEATGQREAACETYRKVVKDCAATAGPEYEFMADEARQRLRKLERPVRVAKKGQ